MRLHRYEISVARCLYTRVSDNIFTLRIIMMDIRMKTACYDAIISAYRSQNLTRTQNLNLHSYLTSTFIAVSLLHTCSILRVSEIVITLVRIRNNCTHQTYVCPPRERISHREDKRSYHLSACPSGPSPSLFGYCMVNLPPEPLQILI